MPEAYTRGPYRFSPDVANQDDFEEATSTQIGAGEFRTVSRFAPNEGEAFVVGQGTSSNPLQAEGSVEADPQNSGGSAIGDKYRLVAVNEANNIVDVLAQGSVSELRSTSANSLDGDVTPFTGTEVYNPFRIAFQLQTASGTADYDQSNSSLAVDGYRGEKLR